ncbi:CsbD family protein [Streptomyces sp. BPTC-684]|uniref:CsbD family protein n=1 Tax=Streptomyces sp. BPTC-684 TaxID=3043734 RepID=UPI0024B08CDA|nr:CsbD family protein [Streptomyces sp. BPTC-684]WHM40656.1 CsbD family protein [Streptomyces sp. BPTC-684]
MRVGNKIRNTAQTITGKIKGGVGRATGNRRLKREGRADRVAGNLKQSGEHVKDAFRR